MCVQLIQFLSYAPVFALLSDTLSCAAPDILGFGLVFLCVFFDFSLVRKIEYYSGIVFEASVPNLGLPLGGGGREFGGEGQAGERAGLLEQAQQRPPGRHGFLGRLLLISMASTQPTRALRNASHAHRACLP